MLMSYDVAALCTTMIMWSFRGWRRGGESKMIHSSVY
jgi:hypothetical protein